MKFQKIVCSILSIVFLGVVAASAIPSTVSAFNANRIIDDSVFDNSSAMSAGQIDSWLNSNFPSSCISPDSGFRSRVPSGYSPSGGFTYGANGTAGEVIATSANVYGINPRVLLVTLQKEQSIVSGGAGCSTERIAKAAGYGCPDSGGSYSYSGLNLYTRHGTTHTSVSGTCVNSASKAGFSQQVIRAAWMLKFSQQRSLGNVDWAVITGSWDNSDDLGMCYGGAMTQGYRKRCRNEANATFYDGNTTIDGTGIHIDTGATAALYRYTPHFHGNENFYNLFNSWFGSVYGDSIGSTIHRLYHPQTNDHYYTAKEDNRYYAKKNGFREDGISVFNVSPTQQAGMVPIYDLYNGRMNDSWLLPDGPNLYWAAVHAGYGIKGVAFYAYPANTNPTQENPLCQAGSRPIYQLWHGGFTDHFYSKHQEERYWSLIYGGYVDDGSSAFRNNQEGGVTFCVPQ